mgnify:CR=1 FL=1
MPFGLTPLGLALTETPGIPETSIKVIEKMIKENCVSDCIKDKKEAGKEIDDKALAICHSECEENEKKIASLEQLIRDLDSKVNELYHCPKCGGLKK